jgi:hypothetical protein
VYVDVGYIVVFNGKYLRGSSVFELKMVNCGMRSDLRSNYLQCSKSS